MIHQAQHTLVGVAAAVGSKLALSFADGAVFNVDLGPVIARHPSLARLLEAKLFRRARLDARGGYVVWIDDELEMAADNLRHIGVEQAGGIGHERIYEWMAQNHLTQERASEALGVSRRMLGYYLSGAKPVPKTLWLACLGWQAQSKAARRRSASKGAAMDAREAT